MVQHCFSWCTYRYKFTACPKHCYNWHEQLYQLSLLLWAKIALAKIAECLLSLCTTVLNHCEQATWQHHYIAISATHTTQKAPAEPNAHLYSTVLSLLSMLRDNGATVTPLCQSYISGALHDRFLTSPYSKWIVHTHTHIHVCAHTVKSENCHTKASMELWIIYK